MNTLNSFRAPGPRLRVPHGMMMLQVCGMSMDIGDDPVACTAPRWCGRPHADRSGEALSQGRRRSHAHHVHCTYDGEKRRAVGTGNDAVRGGPVTFAGCQGGRTPYSSASLCSSGCAGCAGRGGV